MAHKALIGGTAYPIIGGRVLLGGTGYDIAKGRALIGGTGWDIDFETIVVPTIQELMAVATPVVIAGRNDRASGYVSIAKADIPVGASWLFSFEGGHLAVNRITRADASSDPVKKLLAQSSATHGNICFTYSSGDVFTSIDYSRKGDGRDKECAATLALFQFPGYTEKQVDACFSGLALSSFFGKNSTESSAYIPTFPSTTMRGYYFGVVGTTVNFAWINGSSISNIYSNAMLYWAFSYRNSTPRGIVLNGGTYGGSIVQVS